MIKKFDEELRNINVEEIEQIINNIAGYDMLNNIVGFNTLPNNFHRKVFNYTYECVKQNNSYSVWHINWNKVWDKETQMFIYQNQLRFSLMNFEFITLDNCLTNEQQQKLRTEIHNYIKSSCPSYKDAVKDIFNKKRKEIKEQLTQIDKQEEELLK